MLENLTCFQIFQLIPFPTISRSTFFLIWFICTLTFSSLVVKGYMVETDVRTLSYSYSVVCVYWEYNITFVKYNSLVKLNLFSGNVH